MLFKYLVCVYLLDRLIVFRENVFDVGMCCVNDVFKKSFEQRFYFIKFSKIDV